MRYNSFAKKDALDRTIFHIIHFVDYIHSRCQIGRLFVSLGLGSGTMIRYIPRFQRIVFCMMFYVFGKVEQSIRDIRRVLATLAGHRFRRRPPVRLFLGTRYTNLVHGCQQRLVWVCVRIHFHRTIAHDTILDS